MPNTRLQDGSLWFDSDFFTHCEDVPDREASSELLMWVGEAEGGVLAPSYTKWRH